MSSAQTLLWMLVLSASLSACQSDVMKTAAPGSESVSSTPTATDVKETEPPKPPPFDPEQACQQIATLEQTDFPARKLEGSMPKRDEDTPSVAFTGLSGHIDERKDGSYSLQISNDTLRECSPFLKEGGVPTQPTLYIKLPSIVQDTLYRFPAAPAPPPTPNLPEGVPDPTDPTPETAEALLEAWSYRYTTADDYPFTIAAAPDADPGIVVIERVDTENKKVSGKLLLCKTEGAHGWVMGAFDVSLCPYTAPPGDGEDDEDDDTRKAQPTPAPPP